MVQAVDTAVTPVQSTDLAGSVTEGAIGAAPAHDLSMIGMFLQADMLVKTVMVGLILASFWCWYIIFEKMLSFQKAKEAADRFEKEFWSAESLDGFYDRTKKKRKSHPYSMVFMAAMEEFYKSQRGKASQLADKIGIRDRMYSIMQVTRNREMDGLSRGIGVLASVGSAAPFIGLFGTVWGIMNSFQAIAGSNNTSLAIVAPGIAEALFATAIGLFAAIPAVLAYNKYAGELDKFDGRLENFSVEFNTLLSRQMEA